MRAKESKFLLYEAKTSNKVFETRNWIKESKQGTTATYGSVRQNGVHVKSRPTRQDPKTWEALKSYAENNLHLQGVKSAVVFNGVPVLHGRPHYDWSHVVYWLPEGETPYEFDGDATKSCKLKDICPERWQKAVGIQYFLSGEDEDADEDPQARGDTDS